MRIKEWVVSSLVAVSVLVLCNGCEWSAGGGAGSWNEKYNWVNFSGTYRGIGGGKLVTDYSTTPGGSNTVVSISRRGVGSISGASQYSGSLGHGNIVKGSVVVETGIFSLQDDGGGKLAGGGKSGTIEYSTGAWSIDLAGEKPADGTPILASYSYVKAGSSGSPGAGSGASGAVIYSFVIWQNGEKLQITDNNGRVYEGKMGSVTGTFNPTSADGTAVLPSVGDTVISQFSASGISAANFEVTIAGTLQAVVGGTAEAKYLANRQIFGTWIEKGGRTGDINGETSPLPLTGGGGGGETSASE